MAASENITLWTIQNEGAWAAAEEIGVLKPDPQRIWEEFRPPYDWLVEQMKQRIPNYSGGYPVWAWYGHKPDLRQKGHLSPGEKGVRIEFTANPQDILLSDLDAWHCVLNGNQLLLDQEEEEKGYFSVWGNAEKDPERASKVIRSWDRIFDIDLLSQHADWNTDMRLQATLGCISLGQVLDITPFTSK